MDRFLSSSYICSKNSDKYSSSWNPTSFLCKQEWVSFCNHTFTARVNRFWRVNLLFLIKSEFHKVIKFVFRKKRDAGLSYYSGGDADPMSSFDFSSNDDLFNERKNSSTKKLYRGAASVPTVVLRNKDDTDAIAQPHATEETSDNESTALSSDISNPTSPANPPQATTSLPVVTNRAKNGSTLRISTSDQNVFNRNPNQSNNNNRHLENKPHALINSSALHSHQNK